MKRIVKSLFVPLSMMIATSAFAQMGSNTRSGGTPQTQAPATNTQSEQTPSTNTQSKQTPSTNTQSSVGQTNQSNIEAAAGQGVLRETPEQRQQQWVQDSLNKAQKKAAKEQKKAERKARKEEKKEEKKEKKSMPSDTLGTHAVLERASRCANPGDLLS